MMNKQKANTFREISTRRENPTMQIGANEQRKCQAAEGVAGVSLVLNHNKESGKH